MLQSRTVVCAHAHLLHPVGACGLTNQQALGQVGNSLVLSRKTCEGQKRNTESTTSVTMTRKVSCHESSCLANCKLLKVSVCCCQFLYSPSKKLVFVPIASATASIHRDFPVLASVAQ